MTQCERVLDYINKHGSISSMEAIVDLGITRLAARIWELEKKGFVFTKTPVKGKNRYGEPVITTRYGGPPV